MACQNDSLIMLRKIWKEGLSLQEKYQGDIPRDEWKQFNSSVIGWIERVKVVIKSIFYNIKFYDDYIAALQGAYTYENCDVELALSITTEYIKTLGQLLRYGYIKDPVLGVDNSGSKMCFIAMWFDPIMDDIYNYGIKKPLTELGYDVVRVDKQHHNERIDAKIFELIRKSRFLVADFTGNRAGVYYEAGFASGQGIPVVHTCRDDFISKLHFDVKMINTIKYNCSDELAISLRERVKSTIGSYKRKDIIIESDDLPF